LCVSFGIEKVSDYGFVFDTLDLTDFMASFSGEFVIMFVAGMQIEGGKGQVVFAALTIKNLICFLEFLVLIKLSFVEGAFCHLRLVIYS
jgi:hypothetical protein